MFAKLFGNCYEAIVRYEVAYKSHRFFSDSTIVDHWQIPEQDEIIEAIKDYWENRRGDRPASVRIIRIVRYE